jgi:hypothetical protein
MARPPLRARLGLPATADAAGTVAVAAGPRSRLRLLARLVVLAVRPVAAVVVAAPA